MDDAALQAGLLLDLAKQQHAAADAAVKRLTEHTQSLDTVIRDTLRRTLIAELGEFQAELDEAVAALHRVHLTAGNRALWITPIFAVLGASLGFLPMLAFVPTRVEIADRQATVAALDGRSGAFDVRHCARGRGAPKVCVRIDKARGAFGPDGDYYVLR
ncbi:MAG: hypothetical protein ACRDFS_06450 [Chloroflexota bacterium]